MPINKKLYDVLANIARYVLPAMGGLYLTLSEIWNLPLGPHVAASCTAIIVALNVLLGVDSAQYHQTLKEKD